MECDANAKTSLEEKSSDANSPKGGLDDESITATIVSTNKRGSPPTENPNCPQLNINEKLKETLEKHGIAKQNADSFLKGLLMDKDFKDLVKANLDNEDEPSVSGAADTRMTRSKFKEALQNSPFKAPWPISPLKGQAEKELPKFTEIPLSESDDDDEEYKPLDSSFESDPHDQKVEKDKSIKEDEKSAVEPTPDISDLVIAESDVTMNEEAGSSAQHDDMICLRTRSKHSLESTSLNVLEAAFQPPDATEDMYTPTIGDYDWQQWLADLMDDTDRGSAKTDEDDPVTDPDFSFIPELDKPDQEDLRDDSSVQVSKKELNCLLDEIEEWAPVIYPTEGDSIDYSFSSLAEDTVQENQLEKRAPRKVFDQIPNLPSLHLEGMQPLMLQQQLQQHVQLLAQTNVLSRNREDLKIYAEEAKEMLFELKDIGESQMERLGIKSSATLVWNLEEALKLTEKEIPPSEACVRQNRMEKIRGHVPIPKAMAEVIAHSYVFTYKELLPISAPVEPDFQYKSLFSAHEDSLVAFGMSEMSQFPNSTDLIQQHLLPTKTGKQIQARIRNILYCRTHKDTVNPIRTYHTCGILPKHCTSIKYVYPETALKPFDMKDMLPNWLLSIQPIYVPEESSSVDAPNKSSTKITVVSEEAPSEGLMVPYVPPSQRSSLNSVISCAETVTVHPANPIPILKLAKAPVKILPKPVNVSYVTSKIGTAQSSTTSSILVMTHASNGVPANIVAPTKPSIIEIPETDEVKSSSASPQTSKNEITDSVHSCRIISASSDVQNKTDENESEKNDMVTPEKSNKLIHRPSHYFLPSSSSEDEDDDLDKSYNESTKLSFEEEKLDDEGKGNPESEDDGLSDPLSSPIHGNAVKKLGEDDENQKSVKVKFSKTEHGFRAQPIGGYLQKIHPKLSGRKSKSGSKDSKVLFSAAKSIRNLEEDTIVQLDPGRMEKENIFAMGYHDRVRDALCDHPEIYEKFLETLIKYADGTRSPVELYGELHLLLRDWPDLVQAFAPFLMPEQAQECGLKAEQELYGRARRFLRQLEIQFNDNPEHMEKILNVFHTVAGTAIYREEEMMKSILNLLKDFPYLQDEFLTFFENQYPPGIHLDDDFEEVELTEDLMRDPTLNQFEQVTIPTDGHNHDCNEVAEVSFRKGKKRRLSLSAADGSKSPTKLSTSENKENVYPEAVSLDADDEGEEMFNTDYESEEDMEMQELCEDPLSDRITDEKSSTSLPPDITIITEDALSASPFKRLTSKSEDHDVALRPDTPNGVRSDTVSSSLLAPHLLPTPTKSSSRDMSILPATPTGKAVKEKEDKSEGPSQVHTEKSQQDTHNTAWTRETDEKILATCKTKGATEEAFSHAAEEIGCTRGEVEKRFVELLSLLTGGDTDDTSQDSDDDFETTESDVSQDSTHYP